VDFLELEFDTTAAAGAPLGDIASSLVSVDELLRDLATIAGASSAEFRDIQVASITMRNPLKIKLSLLAIPPAAVTAFQDICREVIVFRGRDDAAGKAAIEAALSRCMNEGGAVRLSEGEAQRMHGHVMMLKNATVPLKAVVAG
jgi:hypothetical protein